MPQNALIGSLSGLYDPAQITAIVQAIGSTVVSTLSGFGEDIADVDRTSPQTESYVGADGQVVKWYTNDRRAIIHVHLLPTSPSNATLTSLANLDETQGTGGFSFNLRDALGNDVISFPTGSIRKRPRTVYKKGVEIRVWEIEGYNVQMNILGQGTLN